MHPETATVILATLLGVLTFTASCTFCKYGGEIILRIVSAGCFALAIAVSTYYSRIAGLGGEPVPYILLRWWRIYSPWIITALIIWIAFRKVVLKRSFDWKLFLLTLLLICLYAAVEIHTAPFD
ncbi:MAG: hypothetical protein JWN89_226 [Parcubacteria group bacterium]|nr:hypothetical protein [Parcubacteria group bacterium]